MANYFSENAGKIIDENLAKTLELEAKVTRLETNGKRFNNIDTQPVDSSTVEYVDCRDVGFAYGDDTPSRTTPGIFAINKDGLYLIEATVTFSAGTSGYRRVWIAWERGSYHTLTEVRRSPSQSSTTSINISAPYYFLEGDIVKLGVYQTQGSTLDIEQGYTHIAILKIG